MHSTSIVCAVSLFFLLTPPASGRFQRGTIVGTLTDESGAVISHGKVTLKNLGTEQRSATSDERGDYNLFNHPNFGIPGRTINQPTFGVINSASAGRVVQFGLKLMF